MNINIPEYDTLYSKIKIFDKSGTATLDTLPVRLDYLSFNNQYIIESNDDIIITLFMNDTENNYNKDNIDQVIIEYIILINTEMTRGNTVYTNVYTVHECLYEYIFSKIKEKFNIVETDTYDHLYKIERLL